MITWAAGAPRSSAKSAACARVGIEPVWFDSDRGTAYRAHFADARRVPRCEFVDTFDPDGQFRPVEAVVSDLLEPRRRALPGSELVAAARGRAALPAPRWPGLRPPGWWFSQGSERTPIVIRPLLRRAPSPQYAATHRVPGLPQRGVLVSGKSLAGVQLGDSMAKVQVALGRPVHPLRHL